MKRIGLVVLSLLAQVAACTEPHDTSLPRDAASVGIAAPAVSSALARLDASRFRVALVETEWPTSHGRGAEPCPVHGRTLICVDDLPLAADGDGVHADPVLERAAKDPSARISGHLGRVRGRWPNDALLTTRTSDAATRSYAYRWDSDHWVQIAEWLGIARHIARFDKGVLVEGVDHPDDRGGAHGAVSYIVGTAEQSLPVGRVTFPQNGDEEGVQDLVNADDAVFALGPSDPGIDHLVVERMSAASTVGHLDELVARETRARLWAKSARDVVAFGGPRTLDETPLLRHFDGDVWSDMEPPPGVDIIVAYGRGDGGTERVFAFRGMALSLWERAKGARWESVALPATTAGESIDGHWLTDDDAWLRILPKSGPARLLRMRPVKYVAQLGDGPPTFVPVQGDDRVPAAVPPPPPPAPTPDPSPFHDAVISFRDRIDAMRPNSLHLCPSHGRTWICGVTRVPLVSTDDGVVPTESSKTAPHEDPDGVLPPRTVRLRPPKDLPPGTTRVADYDRTSHSAERLFAYAGDTLFLFERPIDAASHATGPWRPILLPTLPDGDRIHDVWLVNDDAWLLVWPKDTTKDAPHLMRMQPVKKVWSYPRPHAIAFGR